MPINDPRFTHVVKMVSAQLGVAPQLIEKGAKSSLVDDFLAAGVEGIEPRMALLFYLQPPPDGSSTTPVCFMATGDDIPLTGKCCYCIRLSDPFQPLPTKDLEDNLNFGTLSGPSSNGPMQTLMMMVSELYNPLIAKKAFNFSKKMSPENIDQLKASTDGFVHVLEKVRTSRVCVGALDNRSWWPERLHGLMCYSQCPTDARPLANLPPLSIAVNRVA